MDIETNTKLTLSVNGVKLSIAPNIGCSITRKDINNCDALVSKLNALPDTIAESVIEM
jgi:hypothetical protein